MNRLRYRVLKQVTIAIGALSIPWSMFTGFSLGEGHISVGLLSLGLQVVVAVVDSNIWFWCLERMNER